MNIYSSTVMPGTIVWFVYAEVCCVMIGKCWFIWFDWWLIDWLIDSTDVYGVVIAKKYEQVDADVKKLIDSTFVYSVYGRRIKCVNKF